VSNKKYKRMGSGPAPTRPSLVEWGLIVAGVVGIAILAIVLIS